jgi:hypothetical protein
MDVLEFCILSVLKDATMEYLDTLKSKIISGGTITTYQATKK